MTASVPMPPLPGEEDECSRLRADAGLQHLWAILDEVADPEIPSVSIREMGILRNVERRGDTVVVTITPTWSGCPAMRAIAEDVSAALARAGFPDCEVVTSLSPAWSSSWIRPEARDKLRAGGIAPPCAPDRTGGAAAILCPRCGSGDVRCISEFGSTACKALYRCGRCEEPFDYFKPI